MKPSRATLIKRMATELRVAKPADVTLAACELLDNGSRPYGRQFAELGYDSNDNKRRRFFRDLLAAVNEQF